VSALDHRLAARRGTKRAMLAVAHASVVSACSMLSRHEPSQALGATYGDKRRQDHLVDQRTQRIARLGYRVTLAPVNAASFCMFNIGDSKEPSRNKLSTSGVGVRVESLVLDTHLSLSPLYSCTATGPPKDKTLIIP